MDELLAGLLILGWAIVGYVRGFVAWDTWHIHPRRRIRYLLFPLSSFQNLVGRPDARAPITGFGPYDQYDGGTIPHYITLSAFLFPIALVWVVVFWLVVAFMVGVRKLTERIRRAREEKKRRPQSQAERLRSRRRKVQQEKLRVDAELDDLDRQIRDVEMAERPPDPYRSPMRVNIEEELEEVVESDDKHVKRLHQR